MSTAERVRLPDDCTVGYIVEGLLGARLLPSSLFHSHLENLQRLPPDAVPQQVRPLGAPGASPPPAPRRLALRPDPRPDHQPQGGIPSPAANLLQTLCLARWDPGAWAWGIVCEAQPPCFPRPTGPGQPPRWGLWSQGRPQRGTGGLGRGAPACAPATPLRCLPCRLRFSALPRCSQACPRGPGGGGRGRSCPGGPRKPEAQQPLLV